MCTKRVTYIVYAQYTEKWHDLSGFACNIVSQALSIFVLLVDTW